eukprot:1157338-Pelagomonas_calceolata.AAC.6
MRHGTLLSKKCTGDTPGVVLSKIAGLQQQALGHAPYLHPVHIHQHGVLHTIVDVHQLLLEGGDACEGVDMGLVILFASWSIQ